MQLVPLPPKQLNFAGKTLDLSVPQIMGILNVTPDSITDGGQFNQLDRAIAHARKMIQQGASIIDIGGESTRPNAQVVSVEEERSRVIPVVKALASEDVWLSVDTSHPAIIREAIEQGAHIWNDVRALRRPHALQTAVELACPVILMHMLGEPDSMDSLANYDYVVQEVKHWLIERGQIALDAGIEHDNIMVDVGFGFAKDTEHNLTLLEALWQFNELEFAIVAGASRKRFIGDVLKNHPQGDVVPTQDRDIASAAAHLIAVQQGISIVRTHHVKATADMLTLWQATKFDPHRRSGLY